MERSLFLSPLIRGKMCGQRLTIAPPLANVGAVLAPLAGHPRNPLGTGIPSFILFVQGEDCINNYAKWMAAIGLFVLLGIVFTVDDFTGIGELADPIEFIIMGILGIMTGRTMISKKKDDREIAYYERGQFPRVGK